MTDQPIDPRIKKRIREVRSEREAWAHLRSLAGNDNSSPDEIAAAKRVKAIWTELGYHEPQSENGNPITHISETSLGGGKYLHLGQSSDGIHAAIETPENARRAYKWGKAYPTAREGTEAAIASMGESRKTSMEDAIPSPAKDKSLIKRLRGSVRRIVPRSRGPSR
jgi:hypothetical protein